MEVSAAQWPPWSTATFAGLLLSLTVVHVVDRLAGWSRQRSGDSKSEQSAVKASDAAFLAFRRQYLVVYGLVMFADWLQGTHMYSLYQSYGFNVGALFLTGFLSSAVCGSLVGPIVDAYGRRNACLVYCILEIIINVLESVENYAVLLAGRVLGGISTALLFCAFESWMVSEHLKRGFDQRSLSKTFAIASEINGILAVIAGLVAQVAADTMGEIGPFHVAVAVTSVAIVFVYQWPENYGSNHEEKASKGSDTNSRAQKAIATDKAKDARLMSYALGFAYSLFDGAMYIFVFLWYPTLESVAPDGVVPSGLVFSSFMLSIATGGKLFDVLQASPLSDELVAVITGSIAMLSLAVPTVQADFLWVLGGFMVFEVCVGVFTPCCASLRSRYFDSERLSTTLGNFRLPTNVIVVLGTAAEHHASVGQLFVVCSVILGLSTASSSFLLVHACRSTKIKMQ